MARLEIVKLARMLNTVVRTAMVAHDRYPNAELLLEIADLHHWIITNFGENVFGDINELASIGPQTVSLVPVDDILPAKDVSSQAERVPAPNPGSHL
jgi:hypothetical protein